MVRTGRTDERQANPKLCAVLAERLPGWVCDAERPGILSGLPSHTPDLYFGRGAALVLAETKWAHRDTEGPGGAEDNARLRLGASLVNTSQIVEHCLAIRLPTGLEAVSHQDLGDAFDETDGLEWVLFSKEQEEVSRYPSLGWIRGGVNQLAGFIEAVPLSQRVLEEAYNTLRLGVHRAEVQLKQLDQPYRLQIADLLFTVSEADMTLLMAATVVCNALMFQQQLEKHYPSVSLAGCYMKLNTSQPDWLKIKGTWQAILKRNYVPIFLISMRILELLPSHIRDRVLFELAATARELHQWEVSPSHDLIGRVFQWMFADRQLLATYYTRPETATLLSELAVGKLEVDWQNWDEQSRLALADFACGTGTLLTSSYQAVISQLSRHQKQPNRYHRGFMEESLVGLDVLPSATHLTTANLASIFPEVEFGHIRVATAPYGKDKFGSVFARQRETEVAFLGSLEFMVSEAGSALFDSTEGISGELELDEKSRFESFELSDNSIDLVIMNPPFSRQTHSQGDFIEPWAALGTSREEQNQMRERSKRIKDTFKKRFGVVGSGLAGIAPNFFDLGFLKLKPGGVLAMVAPLTLVRGASWESTRKLLARWFKDLTIITLTPDPDQVGEDQSRAFSADTGMGECLVVAIKREQPVDTNSENQQTRIVTLFGRPQNTIQAKSVAAVLLGETDSKNLYVGADKVGESRKGSLVSVVGSSGIAHQELGVFLERLSGGSFLTATGEEAISMTSLDSLGERGPVHRLIGNPPKRGVPQDPNPNHPFRLVPAMTGSLARYQCLWWSRTKPQAGFFIPPDIEAEPLTGREETAEEIWNGASRLHILLEFRLTSNSLLAALTELKTLGGSSWATFNTQQEDWEIPILLWMNTSLGLMLFWWLGSRTQPGRARLTVSQIPDLPVFDVRTLSEDQLKTAEVIFSEFNQLKFLNANRAYEDEVRQALDRAVLEGMCGFRDPELSQIMEELDRLRLAWCREPSVHGGNRNRPQ